MQTPEQIIARVQEIAGKEYITYSPLDRQEVIQLQFEFIKLATWFRETAVNKDRERKLHKAQQMRLLEGTVKDRESTVEESEEYQKLTIARDIAEIQKDHARDTLPVFSSLITIIRDAEKLIGEEIK